MVPVFTTSIRYSRIAWCEKCHWWWRKCRIEFIYKFWSLPPFVKFICWLDASNRSEPYNFLLARYPEMALSDWNSKCLLCQYTCRSLSMTIRNTSVRTEITGRTVLTVNPLSGVLRHVFLKNIRKVFEVLKFKHTQNGKIKDFFNKFHRRTNLTALFCDLGSSKNTTYLRNFKFEFW
jgi:hypothetical protein